MRCSNCRSELIAGKAFCPECGIRVASTCANCAAVLDPAYRYCVDCGTPVATTAVSGPAAFTAATPNDSAETLPATAAALIATDGERKQVTVLFCDLAGSSALAADLDPEEYHDLLEAYLERAFRAVYQYEGIVNQIAGDGFMALFGAPVAHEDAPQRAVHAALGIHQALLELNASFAPARALRLRARIGIHTGPVVVGSVGSDLRTDYSAIGDTTNLAAALETAARPGTVLISAATWRLVRDRFTARALGPITVKGKSAAVAVYEILGLSAAALDEPTAPLALRADRALTPFVGRDAELAQLLACYDRLGQFLPQLAVVVGAAGSGKSRLIHEFRLRLESAPVTWFEVRCSAWTQTVPYAPFAGMLRRHLDIATDDTPARIRERVADGVRLWDDTLETIYPWLCRILGVAEGDPLEMSDDAMKRGTFDAMGALLFHATENGPVIMLIEDAHWLDPLSLEMLYAAASEMYIWPFMMLVTHRREFRPEWPSQPALTQLTLRRLDDGSIDSIMRSLAGGELPAELEARIREKAEGSPFLAEEITRALIEEGCIDCNAETRCTAPTVDDIRIPGTVQEVIAARLDRLTPAAKRVVQVAAVIGRQFDRRLLVALLREEAIDVEHELDELEQRGVLHRRNIFSREEYRFGESLTQEVAYESLLLRQRRQIHERIGELIEAGAGSRDGERSAMLMHHYGLSDNLAKRVETLLAAAVDAEKVPSYSTAAQFYREAWDIANAAAGDHSMRALALRAVVGVGRMAVIYSVADPGDNDSVFAAARRLAEQAGDLATLAALQTQQGMLHMQRGPEEFARGLEIVETGIALAQQTQDPVAIITMQRALAYGYMLDGRLSQAEQTLDEMLTQFAASGQAEHLTDLFLSTRWMRERVYFLDDRAPLALACAQETMALAIRAGNRTIRSSCATLIAQIALTRGEYADAARWAEAAFSVISTIGPHINGAVSAAIVLLANHLLGQSTGLRRYIDFINQNATPLNDLALNANVVTEALLALDEVAIAARRAELAVARAGGRLREMQARLAQAAVLLHRGHNHRLEAGADFIHALNLAERLGMQSARALALLGLAEVAALAGQHDDARRDFSAASAIYRTLGMTHYLQRADGRRAALLEGGDAAA